MLQKADHLFAEQKYDRALIVIDSLRKVYPSAIETRKQALRIWQEASLKMAQDDVQQTDSALQATLLQIDQAKTLLEANKLRQKRDSLRARFEAMCGVVRMIHMRQGNSQPQ